MWCQYDVKMVATHKHLEICNMLGYYIIEWYKINYYTKDWVNVNISRNYYRK